MAEAPANLVGIITFVTLLGLVPFFVVTMTAFLKISVVMFLVRNALGVQQTPPNLVLYGIALVLTVFVSAPVMSEVYASFTAQTHDLQTVEGLRAAGESVKGPIKGYLTRFTEPAERQFFMSATEQIWPEAARTNLRDDDIVILLPAFVASELTRAFEIGFLLYLPFLVIDLVVSNILMAMGMLMVSPMLISVPLKLFLFVAVDGWSRMMHGLILSYA